MEDHFILVVWSTQGNTKCGWIDPGCQRFKWISHPGYPGPTMTMSCKEDHFRVYELISWISKRTPPSIRSKSRPQSAMLK